MAYHVVVSLRLQQWTVCRPPTTTYLLAHADCDRYDLSSLQLCWVGGQTLPAAKSLEFTQRTGCPVHEV